MMPTLPSVSSHISTHSTKMEVRSHTDGLGHHAVGEGRGTTNVMGADRGGVGVGMGMGWRLGIEVCGKYLDDPRW